MIKQPTIKGYIKSLNPVTQVVVNEVLAKLKSAFPDAAESLSYGVIALKYEKVFIYLGGFKNHISIFPPLTENKSLINKTKQYRNKKGNLIFKLDEQIPYDLIIEVAKGLKKQYGQ
jgi:uncharacterized protein YdhG (YjbR/CyaY superfamily)